MFILPSIPPGAVLARGLRDQRLDSLNNIAYRTVPGYLKIPANVFKTIPSQMSYQIQPKLIGSGFRVQGSKVITYCQKHYLKVYSHVPWFIGYPASRYFKGLFLHITWIPCGPDMRATHHF